MLIKRIKVTNYKTYLDLDLDLSVDSERPIILIGGGNGGGKTTLFEAICGALYGLKIKSKRHFDSLLNDGARGTAAPKIILELTFEGVVLQRTVPYVLRRHYEVNAAGRVLENVRMNMNGMIYNYGTFTAAADRRRDELEVSKIIKGNLPQELSRYFLFDAMQSSELLKENVFAQTIRDNIENVMGFNKYMQMNRAAEHLLEEKTKERMDAQEERKEYAKLCDSRREKEMELKDISGQLEKAYRFLADMKEAYDNAKAGADMARQAANEVSRLKEQIANTCQQAKDYTERLNDFVAHAEVNAILPRLAEQMEAEIRRMVKQKEQLEEEFKHVFSVQDVQRIATKVLSYLKRYHDFTTQVDIARMAEQVAGQQKDVTVHDDYNFLDKAEVEALRGLLNLNAQNDFIQLDKTRQTLELYLQNLPNLQQQCETLERSSRQGNETLIKEYEEQQQWVKTQKGEEQRVKNEIQVLTNRINNIDVQMQQEPDPKYDTLVKLVPFFKHVTEELLKQKRCLIETEMQRQLNVMLNAYRNHIGRVEIAESMDNFTIKMYHTAGNEITLDNLNAASKQIFIQVLLKVLRNLGDYNPPVMIDTVMGVLDDESRDTLMEEYFPKLAEQTILLCTTSEIRKDSDYKKLEPFISKTYTLIRNVEQQNTRVVDGYFGMELNKN